MAAALKAFWTLTIPFGYRLPPTMFDLRSFLRMYR